MNEITSDDIRYVITSLDYTVQRIENYGYSDPVYGRYGDGGYPSQEFWRQQVSEAKEIRQKMRDLRDTLKRMEKTEND